MLTRIETNSILYMEALMLHKEIINGLNSQLTKELESQLIYLTMASELAQAGYNGMSSFFIKQAEEELTHAMKIYNYIVSNGCVANISSINMKKRIYKNPHDVYSTAYKHEEYITGSINKLMELAIELKDYATVAMLQWFVTEQKEEEQRMLLYVQKLAQANNNNAALLMIDHEASSNK